MLLNKSVPAPSPSYLKLNSTVCLPGVSAVGVSYGAHAADRLTLVSPLAVVHSMPELRQWLLSNA